MRPLLSRRCAPAAICAALALAGLHASSAADEPVIRVTARKFEYDTPEIILKKGVPVTIELTSLDRVHGFNLPDFKTRADAIPGMVTRVRIVPDKAGTFAFFCDVFCGDGHEEMAGKIVVKD
ncbi:MAG: cupredoxin domain-containing protein [Gammaproteobacteria bacterium]|nr:cupredoxin domain-containing protein [Gammaproteobacteria bacterium]